MYQGEIRQELSVEKYEEVNDRLIWVDEHSG